MSEHVYLSVVLPDGTRPERSRPGKGRLATFAIAVVAMVAGFIALGSLTPPGPVAVEATTTTTSTTIPEVEAPIDPENFSVSQIATGEPLEWDRVAGSATGYPLAIDEHDGALYLFASGHPPWAGEAGGLITWRSTDGEDWEPVGEVVVGREFQVNSIITTPEGFVAAGARPGGSDLMVWWSEDGIEWTAREIPTEADSPYLSPRATAVAYTDDQVVIAGHLELDREGLVMDRLAAAGIEVDLPAMHWDTRYAGEDGIELTVLGPLRIPVLTTTLQELGLTAQERQWVIRGLNPDGQSDVWVVDKTGNWDSGTIPLNRVTNIVYQPEGALFASGWGGAELSDGFVSTDGLQWRSVDGSTNFGATVSWGDRLVAISGNPTIDVSLSADGQTWEKTGVSEMFRGIGRWHPGAIGVGPGGLALTLEGQNSTSVVQNAPTTATLTADGATLRLDFQRSVFVLEIDGETHTWDMYQSGASPVPEEFEVDLAEEVVLFQDPETGETLAEFGLEELGRAETGSRLVRFSDVISHHALAFSRDGSEWEIRDLGPLVGDDSRVRLLEVGLERLIAVTEEPIANPEQSEPSGFEIWSAPLP